MNKRYFLNILILIITLLGNSSLLFSQNQNFLDFDGNDSYFTNDASNKLDQHGNNWTYETWIFVRSRTSGTFPVIMDRRTVFSWFLIDGKGSGDYSIRFVGRNGSAINASVRNDGTGDTEMSFNTWYHIAVSYDGTTARLFVNGNLEDSSTDNDFDLTNSTNAINFAARHWGSGYERYLNGALDEIRFSNTARYTSNFTIGTYSPEFTTDANTILLYHLNENTGTTIANDNDADFNTNLRSSPNNATWRKWDYIKDKHLAFFTEWTGSTSYDWNTATNWNTGNVPTATSDIIISSNVTNNGPAVGSTQAIHNTTLGTGAHLSILVGGTLEIRGLFTNNGIYTDNGTTKFNGSTQQTIPTATYNDLTINNANGVAISGTCTIKGLLNLTSGIITVIPPNLLSILSTGSVSGGSNTAYVKGPIAKIGDGNFVFPVGDNGKWARLGLSNLTAKETFTVQYHKAATPNSSSISSPLQKVSVNEYWEINRAGSVVADVTLYWEDSKWSGLGNKSTLRIAHYDGSNWVAETGGYTQTGNVNLNASQQGSITVTGVNSFSPFTFGTTDETLNTLPVKLLNFDADLTNNNSVILNWATASEINNNGFEIQRSSNGEQWEHLSFIKGAGNSNELLSYSFMDYSPKLNNYYRLKQTDYDGAFSFSPIRFISLNENNEDISIFPNPASSKVNFTGLKAGQVAKIELYNYMGAYITELSTDINQFSVDSFPKGIYIIRIVFNNGNTQSIPFIKE